LLVCNINTTFRIVTYILSGVFKIISGCLLVCNLNKKFRNGTYKLSREFKIIFGCLLAILRKNKQMFSYVLY